MEQILKLRPAKFLLYLLLSAAALFLVINWFTNIHIDSWASLLSVVLFIEALQVLFQPVFSIIARTLGLIGILIIGFFGYATLFWLAFEAAPGIASVSFWDSFIAAWIYAAFIVIMQWIFIAQSDDYFIEQAIKSVQRKETIKSDNAGFVFVQLDGVSAELINWQLKSGNLPNIKKLVESGEYNLQRWKTQIPSTTPASQAGILLGNNDNIPAFRWYDRRQDKMVVANQIEGAKYIEKKLSNGKGLLADGGVSIGNLFSGDATESIMVVSKLSLDTKASHGMKEYTSYFSSIYGFMRAIVLCVGEISKEFFQAWQQKRHDVQPRIDRHWNYILLRAATNVLLRDLQTRIVLQKMMSGVNSIYVDYVDYDEIAHHVGLARKEALDSLTGLDKIVGTIFKIKQYTPRPYQIVILSDHGQSQGPTFKQLNDGKSLEEYLSDLLKTDKITAGTDAVETKNQSRLWPFSRWQKSQISGESTDRETQIVVTGSGNIGNIWIKDYKTRASLDRLNKDFPELIESLLKTSSIGLVIVDSRDGPICLGLGGNINLKTGKISGINPLKAYKSIDYKELLIPASFDNAADIQVISSINGSTEEVYAFEELVGSHGGIGGWQTDAFLLYPSHLKIDEKFYNNGIIHNSTSLFKVLKHWLKTTN